MRCPYCQQDHPDDSLFCPETGQKFDLPTTCPHCGAQVDPDWEHCVRCGSPLIQPGGTAASGQNVSPARKKQLLFGGLVILLGLAGVLGLAVVIILTLLPRGPGLKGPVPWVEPGVTMSTTWTGLGPEGGEVLAMAVNPREPATMYAGTSEHGVFKSTDGGGTWVNCGKGMEMEYRSAISVDSLRLDDSDPNTVYAGGDALFVSRDGCQTWSIIQTGTPEFAGIFLLGVTTNEITTLYIRVSSIGMMRSIDGGNNWEEIGTSIAGSDIDLNYSSVFSLGINPANPDDLFAATLEGLIHSKDGGQTWRLVENGIPTISIYSVVFAPDSSSTLFAGTSQGLYRSVDGGESWKLIDTDLEENPFSLVVIDPQSPGIIYAAVGAQWGNSINQMVKEGLFKSTDGGVTWKETSLGLKRGGINSLFIESQAPFRVFAGTGEGVFFSTDSGGTWSSCNSGLNSLTITGLTISPGSPGSLYAMADTGGVFKSTDSGASWLPINSGLDSNRVLSFVLDPASPAILYAGTDNGLYKSVDGGEHWQNAPMETEAGTGIPTYTPYVVNQVSLLEIDPNAPNTLYAYDRYANLYKSVDGGEKWMILPILDDNNTINTIIIDPFSSDVLYLGTYEGVFKSMDGGGTWEPANLGLPESPIVKSMAIDPISPSTLYAGLFANGIFKSTDAGASWNQIGTDFNYAQMNVYTFNENGTTILYMLGLDYDDGSYYPEDSIGLYTSMDGGMNWSRIGMDLSNLFVHSLLVDPLSFDTLYLGTTRGVFKTNLKGK